MKMKRLLPLLLSALLLAGCSGDGPLTTTPTPPAEVAVHEDVIDEKLSSALEELYLTSFGGDGNNELATSWYPYIVRAEVWEHEDGHYGVVTISEEPTDRTARLLLSRTISQQAIDTIVPVVLDAGSALGLDDFDVALMGENVGKILTATANTDVSIQYSSFLAYGIDIYDYIAAGTGKSRTAVANNPENCKGVEAAAAILSGLDFDYGGSFNGLDMESTKWMAMAANTNFKDAHLDYVIIQTAEEKVIGTYDNTLPKP